MARNDEENPPEPMVIEELDQKAQIKVGTKLQSGLLQAYLRRLENGTLTDTGLAALQRLLMQNGWSLDPAQLPQGLKDMLTTKVDPKDLDDDGVIPISRAM